MLGEIPTQPDIRYLLLGKEISLNLLHPGDLFVYAYLTRDHWQSLAVMQLSGNNLQIELGKLKLIRNNQLTWRRQQAIYQGFYENLPVFNLPADLISYNYAIIGVNSNGDLEYYTRRANS